MIMAHTAMDAADITMVIDVVGTMMDMEHIMTVTMMAMDVEASLVVVEEAATITV